MTFGIYFSTVPAPSKVAHSADHLVSFKGSVSTIFPVDFGTAVLTKLEFLVHKYFLKVFLAGSTFMNFVMACETYNLVARWTCKFLLAEVLSDGISATIVFRTSTYERTYFAQSYN